MGAGCGSITLHFEWLWFPVEVFVCDKEKFPLCGVKTTLYWFCRRISFLFGGCSLRDIGNLLVKVSEHVKSNIF